jgi:hypothetical protein
MNKRLINQLTGQVLRCLTKPEPYLEPYLPEAIAQLLARFSPDVMRRITSRGLPEDPAVRQRGKAAGGGILIVDPDLNLNPDAVPYRRTFIQAALGRAEKLRIAELTIKNDITW